MSSSIKNLYQFRTTSKITQAQGAASTFTVGNDIFTNSAVSLTAGSIQLTNRTGSQIELFTVTVSAGVATIATRGIKPDGTTDAIYQYERPKNTLCTLTVLESQIFDKGGSETLTGNITYSGNIIYTKSAKFPVYADATARDAGIPSPTNGMMIYNTALGINQQYIGGAWVAVDTGTATGNATEGAVGLGELGTTAEVTAGSATGGAGPLILTPEKASAQIQSGTWTYGADAGGDDTYVIALTPTLSAYTTGQTLYAKVTTANTGACSFDFGPGAKNVKKLDGNDPIDGDIGANSIVSLIYDGTNLVLQNPQQTTFNKLAGEDITAGNSLRMANARAGDTISQTTNNISRDCAYDATKHSIGQSFTTVNGGLLTSFQVRLQRVGAGSPAGNMKVELYSDTGTTLIASTTTSMTAASVSASQTNYDFAFASIPLKPATVYYVKVGTTGATSTTNHIRVRANHVNSYAGGTGYDINSGNTRTAASVAGRGDIYFVPTITATTETAGRVYKTSALFDYNTFIVGFARNTATTGNAVYIDQQYNTSQSGLTINTTYYLGNTAGTINTSAGTVSKIIGRSISTTELLINLFG